MTDIQLIQIAQSMLEKSYSPYSHYPVGAALEGTDGQIYTGCNVENAAFGETICAERTAVLKAVSEGTRTFCRIAIISQGKDYCCPCGACRQVLNEFSPDITVLCANRDMEYLSLPLSSLLPECFGPHNLNHKE